MFDLVPGAVLSRSAVRAPETRTGPEQTGLAKHNEPIECKPIRGRSMPVTPTHWKG